MFITTYYCASIYKNTTSPLQTKQTKLFLIKQTNKEKQIETDIYINNNIPNIMLQTKISFRQLTISCQLIKWIFLRNWINAINIY